MKRQFKAAAVVSTAALLAIGASFTSMAAAKTGTWMLESDGWTCLDKNGEAYTDEWCLSYGKEYYVDENGVMATYAWVEDGDNYYFVGSTGAKTVNDWRYVTAANDEDGEEAWFYFDAKGKMVTGKKVIGGKTYYFDQDGKMLTGWVEYISDGSVATEADVISADAVYCDETGARVTNDWFQAYAPGVEAEDAEEEDLHWYATKANGQLRKGKASSIKGKTYFFNDEYEMLTGWVAYDGSNYEEFNGSIVASASNASFYFCDEQSGYVKKDRWIKTWIPEEFEEEDEDNDKHWYHLDKTGAVYVPTSFKYDKAHELTFVDGEDCDFIEKEANEKLEFKKIGNKEYAFKANGTMWTGLVKVYSGSDAYKCYFGGSDDGKMATGAVSIADQDGVNYKFYFGKKAKGYFGEGLGVTGAVDKYLYEDGMLVTQDIAKYFMWPVEIEGKPYLFLINNNGAIQSVAKDYKEDGVVLYSKTDLSENGSHFNTKAVGPTKGAWIAK